MCAAVNADREQEEGGEPSARTLRAAGKIERAPRSPGAQSGEAEANCEMQRERRSAKAGRRRCARPRGQCAGIGGNRALISWQTATMAIGSMPASTNAVRQPQTSATTCAARNEIATSKEKLEV